MENQNSTSHEQLIVTNSSRTYLKETGTWARFIAIVGFIFVGLMAVGGLFANLIFGALSDQTGVPFDFGFGMTVMYLAMALIYFFPMLYLFRFARYARTIVSDPSPNSLELALENLKSHYRFMGILLIIMLALYFLVGLLIGFGYGMAGALSA